MFRTTQCLYALEDYTAVPGLTAQLLSRWNNNPLTPAIYALQGDAQTCLSAWPKAIAAYQSIDPDAPSLYAYGVFQRARIYDLLEDTPSLANLLKGYIEDMRIYPKPRLAEALLQYGQVLTRQGRQEEALQVFQEAVTCHGNDPQATHLYAIIQALGQLHSQWDTHPAPPVVHPATSCAQLWSVDTFLSGNWEQWLTRLGNQALAAEQFTLFGRIRLYRDNHDNPRDIDAPSKAIAQHTGPQTQTGQQGNSAWSTVVLTLSQMDARMLHEKARPLVEQGGVVSIEAANEIYRYLLKTFPASPYSAFSCYHLHNACIAQGEHRRALSLLLQLERKWPGSPVSIDGALARAKLYKNNGDTDKALVVLAEALDKRPSDYSKRAEILSEMARCHEANEDWPEAIACWQRIYSVYRSSSDYLTEAYFSSARCFENLGDLKAALNTWSEYLAYETLGDTEQRTKAAREKQRLLSLVPQTQLKQQPIENDYIP